MTDIAAAMWNHQPRMEATASQLTAAEMRGIASYLWAPIFFQDSGDATAGRRVFVSKHCEDCHNVAPNLNGRAFSEITMVSALWHYGPQMLDEMKVRGILWPRFEGKEMSNLIAFLNSQR